MNQEQAQASQDRSRSMHNIFTGAFRLLPFIGIAVCAICDTAISRSFTWSLYPISAIVFTWLVFIPMIKFGKKGVCGSLLMCSIFIVPFLYVLHRLIRVSDLFFPVSINMAFIGVVYLWCIFFLFRVFRTRKLLASGIALLLVIPVDLFVAFTLSRFIAEPFNAWHITGYFAIAVIAMVLIISQSYSRN